MAAQQGTGPPTIRQKALKERPPLGCHSRRSAPQPVASLRRKSRKPSSSTDLVRRTPQTRGQNAITFLDTGLPLRQGTNLFRASLHSTLESASAFFPVGDGSPRHPERRYPPSGPAIDFNSSLSTPPPAFQFACTPGWFAFDDFCGTIHRSLVHQDRSFPRRTEPRRAH